MIPSFRRSRDVGEDELELGILARKKRKRGKEGGRGRKDGTDEHSRFTRAAEFYPL